MRFDRTAEVRFVQVITRNGRRFVIPGWISSFSRSRTRSGLSTFVSVGIRQAKSCPRKPRSPMRAPIHLSGRNTTRSQRSAIVTASRRFFGPFRLILETQEQGQGLRRCPNWLWRKGLHHGGDFFFAQRFSKTQLKRQGIGCGEVSRATT